MEDRKPSCRSTKALRNGMRRPTDTRGRNSPARCKKIPPIRQSAISTRPKVTEKATSGSTVWFFMGWAAGIVEVWAFLRILGLPADVPSALFIQVWSLIVTRLTTFIPGNLGAQEAGTAMTFSFLGLSVESAIAFAVLRRLRQLGWIAASLGCLAKLSRH